MSKQEPAKEAAEELADLLIAKLPPVIARERVSHFLGGLVDGKTLANADSDGVGPDISWRAGRKVCYRTDSLVSWLVERFKIRRIANLKTL